MQINEVNECRVIYKLGALMYTVQIGTDLISLSHTKPTDSF